MIRGITDLRTFTEYSLGIGSGSVESRVGQELSERFRHIVIACVEQRLTEAVHIDCDKKICGNILDLSDLCIQFRVLRR